MIFRRGGSFTIRYRVVEIDGVSPDVDEFEGCLYSFNVREFKDHKAAQRYADKLQAEGRGVFMQYGAMRWFESATEASESFQALTRHGVRLG